ncbi:hypothetical protein BU23DRAFT_291197 [Bimuria novae-zelandiae CBS 107.79]|uniref:Uncharacterized protein n=1 Tax=Bimuria novae-zelandiae CBS 107.79 TaxID=1447943 RepID=A0A6A5URH3_9PLEO|nr:hypothetical protein BU23DRAFT_291197 [Bimuria novae-zelandiae CBS 107.79]
MSPRYLFRIDEIQESSTATHVVDRHGIWHPSTETGDYERKHDAGAGATGIWWYCNGQTIQRIDTFPQGSTHYQTFSVFYSEGFGFWILRGDATNPRRSEAWHPLSFDHDEQDFSSYLTNAGTEKTLRCQRVDQSWSGMLLPTTNQVRAVATSQAYGGLKGDLAIFLALLAQSMEPGKVTQTLYRMFREGAWVLHPLPHGRTHQRGVVVYVYTCPPNWASNFTAEQQSKELKAYEDGAYGKYYY